MARFTPKTDGFTLRVRARPVFGAWRATMSELFAWTSALGVLPSVFDRWVTVPRANY